MDHLMVPRRFCGTVYNLIPLWFRGGEVGYLVVPLWSRGSKVYGAMSHCGGDHNWLGSSVVWVVVWFLLLPLAAKLLIVVQPVGWQVLGTPGWDWDIVGLLVVKWSGDDRVVPMWPHRGECGTVELGPLCGICGTVELWSPCGICGTVELWPPCGICGTVELWPLCG